jgi:hypothetical protein
MSAKKTVQKENQSGTPDSATDREKSRLDDDAVREAVTANTGPADQSTSSVLPGPPIPPDVQAEIREEKEPRVAKTSGRRGPPSKKKEGGASMVDSAKIKEHMEVVGSDGQHVGTVDHCEGKDTIKLTKNDPAANGEHHYISLDLVSRIDRHVHLSQPASKVMQSWR